jgi:hypothetical protein
MRIGLVDAADEDFAVANAAGAGGAHDGLNRLILHIVVNHHLDLHLGQEVDGIFTAAIELGVALLAAVAAGFENGHAFDARFKQRILHGIQFGGLETASIFSISGELPRSIAYQAGRVERRLCRKNLPC